jgi:[ribosomal protein S5]-alanine N-acetyltransferase
MIIGKNINLRTVRGSDLNEIYNLHCDINNRGEFDTLGILAEPLFKKDYQEGGFWKESMGTMVITDKEDKIIGSVSFFKSIPYFNGFEIGFNINDPQKRGKGIGTEATLLFIAYLFEVKEMNRLQATTLTENISSIRVLEKCGFKLEGRARQAVFNRGRYMDVNIYSILRGEHKSFRELL